jgi:outer membrane biosynthesis protein TonB
MILSSAAHLLLLILAFILLRATPGTEIVAAGEGQGVAQSSAIEVGVVDARQLGFTPPRAVTQLGEAESAANNEVVETKRPAAVPEAEPLPSEKKRPTEKARETERPTAPQTEQLVTKTPQTGRTSDKSVEVGRSYGAAAPAAMAGGIGISSGGAGGGSGVPGGSEYGRRIQMILSRNYNPPGVAGASGTSYVVIHLRIASDGRILSLVGGRVGASYIKQQSPHDLVNRAAERAVIASNPLPSFPPGFLSGASEATAVIWFRYPK